MSDKIKKTFKDFTEKEIRELTEKQEKAIKVFKEQNKINKILLFGICDFGNQIISNIKDMPNVSKLYTETDKKYLENFDSKDTYLFLKEYKQSKGLWDENNYSEIYKLILKNKQEIVDKIKEYDYIIICTCSNYEIHSCLTEAVADICSETQKRFMICHSTDDIFSLSCIAKSAENLKIKIKIFINKMEKKKYIVNEIPRINTSFTCDKIDFEYQSKTYTSFSLTYTNIDADFNTKVFAKAVECNIVKMMEG